MSDYLYKVQKTFEISAAHKLCLDYPSKCSNLHGHNWKITVCVRSMTLDSNGMVVDFSKISQMIKDEFDHKNLNDVLDVNPTAENIGKLIMTRFNNTFALNGATCYKVIVQESEGNIATVELMNDADSN